MKMEWISLDKELPPESAELVIGCDWLHGEFRVDICENDPEPIIWYGQDLGKKGLPVYGSICPNIGHGISPYWSLIPEDDDEVWNKFNEGDDVPDEFIVKFHNGSCYVGYIKGHYFLPSFSISKMADINAIKLWMKIPYKPCFIKPPPLSLSEEKEKEKRRKNENDYKKLQK